MNIAIVGYGRMGHEVESILRARGHEVRLIADPTMSPHGTVPADCRVVQTLAAKGLAGIDAAIEFSLPEAVLDNARAYAEAGCPAVVGTTGWIDQIDAVRDIVAEATGVVFGSNFSIGAHIFMRAAKHTASLVSNLAEYDLQIHEMHHNKKKDSPSGTALSLAHAVLEAVPRKTVIETGRLDRAPEAHELHVSSSRIGWVPGTHSLLLDSVADSIEVRHQARNRSGFALGAVLAAEWIPGKLGVHGVEEFIADLVDGK